MIATTINSSTYKYANVMNDKAFSIFLISGEPGRVDQLCRILTQEGYICSMTSDVQEAREEISRKIPDLVLVVGINIPVIRTLCQTIKQEVNRPIIALINTQELNDIQGHIDFVDDFFIAPVNMSEVSLRITRLLGKSGKVDSKDIIRCGDLTIDTAKYEVFVGNMPVALTFTEYELLKFLVTNKGRVFSRETLLNRVWGYDYFGGDRTVDVHIKRLRSKIEISDKVYIETVRSIGYRFKDL